MSAKVRIDERAFNRGVEEVVTLKPLVRAVRNIISHMDGPKKGVVRSHDGKLAIEPKVHKPSR